MKLRDIACVEYWNSVDAFHDKVQDRILELQSGELKAFIIDVKINTMYADDEWVYLGTIFFEYEDN